MTDTVYAPARPGLAIPMPDRGNRLMPAGGIAVDMAMPYYRRLRDDGDIVVVANHPEQPAATPARRKLKRA